MSVRWYPYSDSDSGDSDAAVGPLRLLVWEGLAAWRWVVQGGAVASDPGGTACASAEARALAENAARAMLDSWRAELGEVTV